jgi:predicted enzyme related to lactoylglutathione lyase
MGSKVFSVTIDCADPSGLASFWEQVLDYRRTYDGDDEVAIEPRGGAGDRLLFIKVPDDKKVKNRLHLDLNPTDQAAEVERVKALGATEVDIGQRDVTWVVLADPEGNEFCILTPR